MSERVTRVEWVDAVKLWGMLLVVAGHHEAFGTLEKSIIFSFHMPLFFFLSGLFVKKRGIFGIMKKGIKSYILPYIVLTLACAFTAGYLRGIVFGAYGAENYDIEWMLKTSFLYGNGWSLMWFLPCLFTVSVLMEVLLHVIANDILRGIAIAAINIVTVVCIPGPLFWELHEALVALLFVYLGYMVRKYALDESMTLKSNVMHSRTFRIQLVVVAIVWTYCVIQRIYVNMVWSSYPAYPLSIVGAICGIELFILLVKCIPDNDFIRKMGKNSLLIYMVHCIEHNFIPWEIINSGLPEILSWSPVGVRVCTLLVRAAGILLISAIIIEIKERCYKRLKTGKNGKK